MGKKAEHCRLCNRPLDARPEKSLPHTNGTNREEVLWTLLLTLAQCRGNKSQAARVLGVSHSTVMRQLNKLKGQSNGTNQDG